MKTMDFFKRVTHRLLLKAFHNPHLIWPFTKSIEDQTEKSLEICSAVLESDSKCFWRCSAFP